jgi:WD40 repeat protein
MSFSPNGRHLFPSPSPWWGAKYLAWSGDSKRFAARYDREEDPFEGRRGPGKLAVSEVANGKRLRSWPVTSTRATAIALGHAGNRLIRGDEDGTLHLLDVHTGKELAHWQAHDSAITALAVSPDGRLLVSGARDGTVRVWNLPWIRAELRKVHPDLDW